MVSPSLFLFGNLLLGICLVLRNTLGLLIYFLLGTGEPQPLPSLHTSCEKFPKLLAFEQIVTDLPLLSSRALDKRVDPKAIQPKWQQFSQKPVESNFLIIIGGLQYFTVLISDTECKRIVIHSNAMELTARWFD